MCGGEDPRARAAQIARPTSGFVAVGVVGTTVSAADLVVDLGDRAGGRVRRHRPLFGRRCAQGQGFVGCWPIVRLTADPGATWVPGLGFRLITDPVLLPRLSTEQGTWP